MSDDFDFGSIDVSGMKREVKRVNETGKPGTNKQSQFKLIPPWLTMSKLL